MMWYMSGRKEVLELDYSRPIVAEKGSFKFLLLPVRHTNASTVKGYDWFNLNSGAFNSSTCWKEPTEAVRVYQGDGYNVYNVMVITTRIN